MKAWDGKRTTRINGTETVRCVTTWSGHGLLVVVWRLKRRTIHVNWLSAPHSGFNVASKMQWCQNEGKMGRQVQSEIVARHLTWQMKAIILVGTHSANEGVKERWGKGERKHVRNTEWENRGESYRRCVCVISEDDKHNGRLNCSEPCSVCGCLRSADVLVYDLHKLRPGNDLAKQGDTSLNWAALCGHLDPFECYSSTVRMLIPRTKMASLLCTTQYGGLAPKATILT